MLPIIIAIVIIVAVIFAAQHFLSHRTNTHGGGYEDYFKENETNHR